MGLVTSIVPRSRGLGGQEMVFCWDGEELFLLGVYMLWTLTYSAHGSASGLAGIDSTKKHL